MTERYKVEITYTEGDPSLFYLYADGTLELADGGTPIADVETIIGNAKRLCVWLQKNGGSKIEITEESS